MPAFHGMLVVRDEGDILAQTLQHILSWCDTLSILDTGSTDDSWEIVQAAAAGDARVHAQRQDLQYHRGVRGIHFDRVRHRFRHGDWIVRLDADEFYHIAPPAFVRERVGRLEGRIRALMFEFVLTESDVASWQEGRESIADRTRPITERRRRYYIDTHPEVRLFRYRRRMRWRYDRGLPLSPGLTAYERIPVRHYRCRDLEQLQRRCAVRSAMASAAREHASPAAGHHWNQDWRYWIWRDDDPRLRTWEPGTELPDPRSTRSARGTWPHMARQLYYGSGAVYLADLLRRRGPSEAEAIRPGVSASAVPPAAAGVG